MGNNKKTRTVHIVGRNESIKGMFIHHGWAPVNDLQQADLVQFTGGADVFPGFYGEEPLNTTRFDKERDDYEKAVFESAIGLGLPCAGICRGAQFVHVMNGGKLWQHVLGHATGRNHVAKIDHTAFINPGQMRKEYGETMFVSSTHHQMMKYDAVASRCVRVLTANVSTYKQDGKSTSFCGLPRDGAFDVEAMYYPATNTFSYQPHPEYFGITDPCQTFYFRCLKQFLFSKVKIVGNGGADDNDGPW